MSNIWLSFSLPNSDSSALGTSIFRLFFGHLQGFETLEPSVSYPVLPPPITNLVYILFTVLFHRSGYGISSPPINFVAPHKQGAVLILIQNPYVEETCGRERTIRCWLCDMPIVSRPSLSAGFFPPFWVRVMLGDDTRLPHGPKISLRKCISYAVLCRYISRVSWSIIWRFCGRSVPHVEGGFALCFSATHVANFLHLRTARLPLGNGGAGPTHNLSATLGAGDVV